MPERKVRGQGLEDFYGFSFRFIDFEDLLFFPFMQWRFEKKNYPKVAYWNILTLKNLSALTLHKTMSSRDEFPCYAKEDKPFMQRVCSDGTRME